MFLLDSNACIIWMRGGNPVFDKRVLSRPFRFGDVVLCSVVKAELIYGTFVSQNPRGNLKKTEDFFQGFPSLAFDDNAARHYGDLRAFLRRKGQQIGPNDLLIAATALAHGAILVTHNIAEFSRVPGLLIEDWEA